MFVARVFGRNLVSPIGGDDPFDSYYPPYLRMLPTTYTLVGLQSHCTT